VIDRWTTQHGSWDVDITHPYGIDLKHSVRYSGEDIPGKGASTHIFVKALPGSVVTFMTSDGANKQSMLVPPTSWVNFPMFHSSAYNPDKGEVGPWQVWVDGVMVAEGIGLPHSQHVSTFLVVAENSAPPVPPVQGEDKYLLYKNGVLVWES
jgi:hypothetical protein